MSILYLIGVRGYGFLIRLASLFHPKAREWVRGRARQKTELTSLLADRASKRIWFHCASLGEFEQGYPVLKAIRSEYPHHTIVLTFFSPSGYQVKKNDPVADYVFYMPLDGPVSSKKFIEQINPSLVFFVKYEFWHYYGHELFKRKIPFFCISAIFRPGQLFFKPGGDFFRKMLLRYTHMFVQDQDSLKLLYQQHITQVTVSGDTRFDRVISTSRSVEEVPEAEFFAMNRNVIICGSTWSEDENVLIPVINSRSDFRFIIAPHEIDRSKLQKLKERITRKAMFFSEYKPTLNEDCEVLIIDNVGLLSRLYRYGNLAYIGGGFGKGIHNILEAVVYGLPVVIGPRYHKFREANDLVKLGGVFSLVSTAELERILKMFDTNASLFNHVSEINRHYVDERKGATEVIMNYLRINY